MYAKQIIFAALSAATVAIAAPTPGLIDHAICSKIINTLIDGLKTTISDTLLISGGAPPAAALLRTSLVVVDDIWETQTKATAAISNQQIADVTTNLVTVQSLLTGTDAETKTALSALTLAQTQLTLVAGGNCETKDI
ncbi:hypothetical protein LZ30DRAFT_740484 [Colletotrichum cereale]|nr:hypothetical protein LZ30DRAFT_740484 [Colletotrichum cereale]